ncbi:MAG: bifunctional 3,4-dihydroxy-2-butanone-4-phosphate synthase/GTP cyclohydrolase II, partial [Lutibacter sp.]|nr:bifunctional 3,4-dihydroxy-2-butanone-4-phosphate synthase/GTP cyclohydrolase II [Lutibacter sp.]
TNNQVHIALTKGAWEADEPILVRVNSSLINNDILRLLTAKPDDKFSKIFKMINDEGKGAAVFISQENQSFDLINRLSLLKEAQKNTEHKVPQIQPDDKDFGIGAQILHDLEISKLRVLSNAPAVKKRIGMTGYGLEIVEYVTY